MSGLRVKMARMAEPIGSFRIHLISLTLSICLWPGGADSAEPWPAESRIAASNIGANLVGFEPSGAVYHPGIDRIVIVGDGGNLAFLTEDGQATVFSSIAPDLEAVAYSLTRRRAVFVGTEDPPSIREVCSDTGEVLSTWQLEEMVVGPAGERLEGLTFLPNAATGTLRADSTGELYNEGRGSRFGLGGLFLAGHQGSGRIYVFDLEPGAMAHLVAVLPKFAEDSVLLEDLSGLDFHRASGLLYVLFDNPSSDGVGRVLAANVEDDFSVFAMWNTDSLSSNNEGLALLDSGFGDGLSRVVIAEDDSDSHRVSLYEDFALALVPTTTTTLARPFVCGDVDLSGTVTAGDALRILRFSVGLGECDVCLCDVISPGGVTAADALAVLRATVGIFADLSCCPCGPL